MALALSGLLAESGLPERPSGFRSQRGESLRESLRAETLPIAHTVWAIQSLSFQKSKKVSLTGFWLYKLFSLLFK